MRHPETTATFSKDRESGGNTIRRGRRGRGGGVAAIALLATVGLAACTSSASSPNTSRSSSSAAASAPASPTTSAHETPRPTEKARPAGCTTSELKEAVVDPNGTAGSTYWTITFKNIGGRACTLYGYPGVSLVNTKQIGMAADRDTSSHAELVTLEPGITATAQLRVTDAGNYPPDRCTSEQAAGVKIYAPNTTEPEVVAMKGLEGCAPGTESTVDVLLVGAVVG